MSIGLRPHKTRAQAATSSKRQKATDASQKCWKRFRINCTIALYERALDRDSENHLLILDLARAYAVARRSADAQVMLRRVLTLYPASALVRAKAAQIYARLRCPQEALDHYHKAVELNPRLGDESEVRAAIAALSEDVRCNRVDDVRSAS